MDLELDATGRRIVGVLIEKEATTPNLYPLTTNAVQTGASQKSNRSPVLDFQTFEIEGALRELMVNQWVTQVTGAGSRTQKWRHRAGERLDVSGPELAIMGELLLRGAQHPGELRTRASRMVPIEDMAQLERLLENLESKRLVRRLPRQAGERAARVDHGLYPAAEGIPDDDQAFGHAESPPPAAEAPPTAPSAVAPSAPAQAPGEATLARRVSELEAEVRVLRERLDRLEHE